MLRHTLNVFACLAALASVATAQMKVQMQTRTPKLTTLGRNVPELHSTVLTLATVIANTKKQDRTLATASWQALALGGMGSNMRSGPRKAELKTLVAWLTREQTVFTDPTTPRPDRATGVLMALVFTRVRLESNYKLLNQFIEGSIKTWLPLFDEHGAKPPTTEETALLAMLAQSLKDAELGRRHKQMLSLAKRGAAITPTTRVRLHAAARHLVELTAGAQLPPELTLAQCWPEDPLADPLHAWLGAFAVRTLPKRVRTAHWQRVKPLIAKREASHLWPKAGDRDALTTTAMMLAVIGMCYGEQSPPKTVADPVRKQKGDPWQGPIK